MSALKKIENLSKYAWEQVDRNPEEAKELFKMIYELAKMSNKKNVDYNPLSIDEDFYITPREVEPREFSQEQEDKDIAYLVKNLFEAIKIPKEYFKENEE